MEGTAMSRVDEAQLKSDAARKVFEVSEGLAPWMDDYFGLLAEGWPWRQAVFMIWAALPKYHRQPRTQKGLAVEVLGLTSDRVIRTWRQKNQALDVRVGKLTKSMLMKARSDIFAALIAAATNPNPRAHADRKLALEMTGDYVPRQVIQNEGPRTDMSDVDEVELAARAMVPGCFPEGETACGSGLQTTEVAEPPVKAEGA